MTQTSFEFTVLPGQVWALDGTNYRVISVSRGTAKLLPVFMDLHFRAIIYFTQHGKERLDVE